MKFTCSVTIDLPREKVIELFDNPDNMKEWQDGFESFEHISGTPGEIGAKSKITYRSGKREMILIETLTVKNLPTEFSGTYETDSMANSLQNIFTKLGPEQTRFDSHIEYTRLSGFMVKTMAFLFPGMFKKQVQKWMDQFKEFAERVG